MIHHTVLASPAAAGGLDDATDGSGAFEGPHPISAKINVVLAYYNNISVYI
jgi:hypothetical protein